jgi:aconitate hydratase
MSPARGVGFALARDASPNRSLENLLAPGAPVAHTVHAPTHEVVPIWEAARRYRDAGLPVVMVAGHRYGTGSSRDWAAKGQSLLGIRAVLAASFERIHRSNLVGMGILPIRLPEAASPRALALAPGDRIEIDADARRLRPRVPIRFAVLRRDGGREEHVGMAAVETDFEAQLLRDGGVIPHILRDATRRKAA